MTEQDSKQLSEISEKVAVLADSVPRVESKVDSIDAKCQSFMERMSVAESHIDDLRSDRNKPAEPCRKEMGVIHKRVDNIVKPSATVTASKIAFWAAIISALIGGLSAVVVALN